MAVSIDPTYPASILQKERATYEERMAKDIERGRLDYADGNVTHGVEAVRAELRQRYFRDRDRLS